MMTYEGEESFAKMIFQGDVTDVPLNGNFYIGVCKQTPAKTDVLSTISTEPSSAGGYARIAIPRNALSWPTIGQVALETRIQSIIQTFTAVGADFSSPFTRLFLTNAASGTVGILFCYSGEYSGDIALLDGQSQDFKFEFYP